MGVRKKHRKELKEFEKLLNSISGDSFVKFVDDFVEKINEKNKIMETVTIEKEKLKMLLDKFHEVCDICDELDIYEHEELDNDMQEMKSWVKANFGKIK